MRTTRAESLLALGPIARLIGRVTGRQFHLPELSALSIFRTAAASAGAFTSYGIAFWVFCMGVFGAAAGSPLDYIKIYSASYLVGYVMILAPRGIVVREVTLQLLMVHYGLLDKDLAIVAAWTSRIWLTIPDILPGLLLVLFGNRGGAASPAPSIDREAGKGASP